MKISTLLVSALFVLVLQSMSFAQNDKSFNYQAVVRKATGDLVQKTDVTVKFYIFDDTGTTLYAEKQDATTDAYGVLNLSVGTGSKLAGAFETLDWNQSLKLKVEVDYDKNGTADLTGSMPITKVPSAYYSAKAGLAEKANGLTYDLAKVATSGDYNDLKNTPDAQTLSFDKTTNILSISKGNTVDLSKLNDGLQNLSLSGNLLSIGGGNTVDLSNVGVDYDNQTLSLSGNTLSISGGNSVTIAFPSGSGTGDMVTTTYDTNTNGKVDVAENSEKIANVAVAATAPSNGQVLTYNGSTWAPAAAASGLPTLSTAGSILTVDAAGTSAVWKAPVTMSGDISVNASGNVTVDKLKNTGVSATAPTSGQVLTYNGSAWAPVAPVTTTVEDLLTSTSATNALSAKQGKALNDAITLENSRALTAETSKVGKTDNFTGDVTGAYNATTVAKIQSTPVSATVPTSGQVLSYNGTAWAPVAPVTTTVEDLLTSTSATNALSANQGKLLNDALANKVDKTITVNGKPLTANVTITAADLSLDQVNNTADADKPLSNATISALQLKAFTGGDLDAGTAPSTSKVTGIQEIPVSATAPTSGQVLSYNGTAWAPVAPVTTTVEDLLTSTSATNALSANQGKLLNDALATKITAPTTVANGDLLKFDGTNWVAGAPGGVSNADATTKGVIQLAGDLAGTGSVATAPVITNKAVTYAKMQDVAATSLIGNSTGSTATAQEITLGDGLSFDASGKLSTKKAFIKDIPSANYTILDTDYILLAPAVLGTVTLTFPTSDASTKGRILYIINLTANNINLAGDVVNSQTGSFPTLSGGPMIDTGSGWLCMNGQ